MTSEASAPTEFTYTDAHGIEIFAYEWPAEHPHAVVQIAHGVGEHALRYARFAEALVAAGFTVVADDHRGHGRTGLAQWGGDHAQLGKLGPGGLRAAEAAVLQLTGILRGRDPELPVIMFAHSWGSLMAQRILNREPHAWDALVLSGSAYRTVGDMESGDLNRAWRDDDPTDGFSWLSRDLEVGHAFAADPLCFAADIMKLWGVADALRLAGTPGKGLDPALPILIASGSEDPLSRKDSIRKLAEAYRKRGVRDVTLRIYPEARHEILNETNQEQVTAEILTWLLERFPRDE